MSTEQACGEPIPVGVLTVNSAAVKNVNNLQASIVTSGTSSFVGGSCTPANPLTGIGTTWQPMTGIDTVWNIETNIPNPCKDYHTLTEELLNVSPHDDQVVGTCERCGIRVFVPKIPGAFSYERAGAFVGQAMSLDDEDEMPELLNELAELEEQIRRDQKRLERAREILQIARTMAKKHAIKQVAV